MSPRVRPFRRWHCWRVVRQRDSRPWAGRLSWPVCRHYSCRDWRSTLVWLWRRTSLWVCSHSSSNSVLWRSCSSISKGTRCSSRRSVDSTSSVTLSSSTLRGGTCPPLPVSVAMTGSSTKCSTESVCCSGCPASGSPRLPPKGPICLQNYLLLQYVLILTPLNCLLGSSSQTLSSPAVP